MPFDTPLTEFLCDRTSSHGNFDIGDAFDFDANVIATGSGVQTTSWGHLDLQVRTQLGTLLDEHSPD